MNSSPDEVLIRPLEARPVDVLPRVQLVEGADRPDEVVGHRPGVDVAGELDGVAPQDATPSAGRGVLPFAVAAGDEAGTGKGANG